MPFAGAVLLLSFGLACSSGLLGGPNNRPASTRVSENSVSPTSTSTSTPEPASPTSTPEPATETPEVTEEPTFTPTVTPTPTLNLADRQVLHLPSAKPTTLDPHLTGDAFSFEYIVEIFSGLMAYDPELNLMPDLAESYNISPDGLVYTFRLRPEAQFHNGQPIRAQDFKWSFERACDPATGSHTAGTYLGDIVGCREKLQGQVNEVRGVAVVDDRTLQLTIDEPKGFFLAKMAYPTAYVLDRQNVESGGATWFTQPNGSGPFKLSLLGQNMIVLEKNQNYYREPKPILKQITCFFNIPLDLLSGYEKGLGLLGRPEGVTYDIIQVSNNNLATVADPNNPLSQELVSVNLLSVNYIGFNVQQPPFDNVKIRQALNLALDKRTIVKAVQGNVYVANGIVPLNMPGYQNPDLSDYEFDLEHALDLIAESSYGDVSQLPPLTLHVGTGAGNLYQTIAASYRTNLGLEIRVEQVPFPEFLANLNRPDTPYQMYYLGWVADYPDPQNFLEVLFHSKSAQNYGRYHNPVVDDLLNEARGTQNIPERLALYRQVEQLILDDAAWIPLYFEVENWLIKPYVKNFRIPPIKVPKFQYVYIEAL
ncbi:MAG: peptide ABC transporter substrate-binding protein [Anaerolineae bacterium]|nr:peptide ABC transporter substrate-binding protein [Anaerolineae bacterium]